MCERSARACLQVHPSVGQFVRKWSLSAILAVSSTCGASLYAQTGQFAYTANTTPAGTLSGFVVNSTSGALADVSGSPFNERFAPQQLAVDPAGKFLFVLNPDTDKVSMFQIDGSTGALSEVPNSPFSTGGGTHPQAIAIGIGGKYVLVGNATSASVPPVPNDGSIDTLLVDTQRLVLIPVTSRDTTAPVVALITDPKQNNLYALLGLNLTTGSSTASLLAFSIDPGSGIVIPSGTTTAGDTGRSLAMHPQGTWLFAGSGKGGGEVDSFPILPVAVNGSLFNGSGVSFVLGAITFPNAMAAEGSGQFLYVATETAIKILSVDSTSGVLKETSASPLQLSAATSVLLTDPQGPFLYALIGGKLRGFKITDTTTGALQEIAGSPFDGTNSSAGLAITGSAVQPISGPFAEFAPNSLSFGSWTVGKPSNTILTEVVNAGGQTLNINSNSISFTGLNAGDFSQTNNCGTPLVGNATCSISVIFTPMGTGTRTAALSVPDNAPGSPQSVPLTGTGLPLQPAVTLVPGSLNFPPTVINQSSQLPPIQVTNSGTDTLHITGVTLTGANKDDYTETTACGTVAVNTTCNINVTFAPKAAGTRVAAVSIMDDAPDTPQSVSLTGMANNPFGLQPNGTNPTSITVTAGQTAQYSLQVLPAPGYAGTITLACSGVPTAAACQLSSTTLQTSGGSPVNFTASVTTTARSALAPPATPLSPPPSRNPIPLLFLGCLLAILCRLLSRSARGAGAARRLTWERAVSISILLATMIGAAGCGGGGSGTVVPPPPIVGTPAGTYTVTVTGAAGSFSGKIDLTLIVK
jgi:Lactonase, 7-bladed beta-propeller